MFDDELNDEVVIEDELNGSDSEEKEEESEERVGVEVGCNWR